MGDERARERKKIHLSRYVTQEIIGNPVKTQKINKTHHQQAVSPLVSHTQKHLHTRTERHLTRSSPLQLGGVLSLHRY